ncbi:MAG TPA: hypothetical protein VMJ12_06045 [Candidatus Acidoferrales bacterium]|nr:hypothetical protein [Candidatus Acidoferrales bacterium]
MEPSLRLRVGDWVEIRSPEEILATLDDHHTVDALPFMPEMLQYCGKRFRVYKSAHKTSDTMEIYTIRRMENAVHLEGLRCDGASHGGCQAGCLLFWKESWLKRVAGPQMRIGPSGNECKPAVQANDHPVDVSGLLKSTRKPRVEGSPECFQCQATEMLNATAGVRRRVRFGPFFYLKDLTSGNVGLFDFIRFGALAILNCAILRRIGHPYPRIQGMAGDKTPTCDLKLQPGELVRVKTKKEIMQTLNRKGRNRGLWFDVEMLPFCGKGPFRVLQRAEKFLNEKTGEMLRPGDVCIILEGVTCSGNYSHHRMFSPRNEYIFWHEIWLERIDSK